MSQRSRQKRDQRHHRRRTSIQVAVGAVAVLLVIVIGVSALDSDGSDDGIAASGSTTVSMTEFAFSPDPIVVSQADAVLTVVNDGSVAHDLLINELGKGSPDLPPGQEFELDLTDQPPGTYDVICDLPGHVEAGMVTKITIE